METVVLKKRTPKSLLEITTATVRKAVMIADRVEGSIKDLEGTAMFPVKRDDVGLEGNTP